MKSFHIHIKGRVQGIGFRPFIYNLAKGNGLKGTVSNTLDGVHIFMNCEVDFLKDFIAQIHHKAPKQSLITATNYEEIPYKSYSDFEIIDSELAGTPDLLITPDFAICDQCKKELKDPENRRYQYPFITCTSCGPRFSIEDGLPYDRSRTSMNTFQMCPKCEQEFSNSVDKRFYSQTNSCPNCKISQWVVDNQGTRIGIDEEGIVDFVCDKIRAGAIVAVKGIGGFLLICDASNEDIVSVLRKHKDRPVKPFALLYPDVDLVKDNHKISKVELEELQGAAAPILLLSPKNEEPNSSICFSIAPGLDRLGVMLPYAPLLVLIAEKLRIPLLATSGNQKGSPIIYKNQQAIKSLSGFADYFLFNNREIQIPQDDSVVKFSHKYHKKIIIRRSRGFAPGFLQKALHPSFDKDVLAMGALLKSTFSVWQQGRCHVSQYLGDTTEFDAQISFERTFNHFKKLLRFQPEVILVDKHPAYFSTQLGKHMATADNASIVEIQHHKAHLWAVLGENELLEHDKQILGVVFDGTGMGNDGAVWGGEFFRFESGKLKRANHLKYFPHILGDKMAREPRLSALSLLYALGESYSRDNEVFSNQELDFFAKVLESSTLQTSSMGRVFDAVSSLLDFGHINTYEGEAAMYLECAAQKYCNERGCYPKPYANKISSDSAIDLSELLRNILDDINLGIETGQIAAKFHSTIVQIIEDIALQATASSIAFSGGVFQNGLLVDMIVERLDDDYNLYFHNDLSPNDECISYGQLVGYYFRKKIRKGKKKISQAKLNL